MQGEALSGGDHIFIELTKRWQHKIKTTLYISKEGEAICNREGLNKTPKFVWASDSVRPFGYFLDSIYRTTVSARKAFLIDTNSIDVVFSSSDFWPDFIPALILKTREPKIHWIGAFYLFAPKPWKKNSPYRGKSYLTGMLYWISQQVSYYCINRFSDVIFVTSQPDVKRFVTHKRSKEKVIAIKGGVDTSPANNYLNSGNITPLENRKYDACFVGRFHYQKGVLELINIWKKVCKSRPNALLSMIGIGPLENKVKTLINQHQLTKNINLLGFMVGNEKFNIFKQSKIVVHPATYDSGGMAAAEAMAWGLPGVSFDLEALKSYYPRGMVKTKCFDHHKFADNILALLSDHHYHQSVSQEALELVRMHWDWDLRAAEIYDKAIVCNES